MATGTFHITQDRTGFGIQQIRLLVDGQEIALLEFLPGDNQTYLQPGEDICHTLAPEDVLAILVASEPK